MNYKIEKRQDSYYLITDKYYKDDVIVINLSTILKIEEIYSGSDIVAFDPLDTQNKSQYVSLMYALRYDENNKRVYVDLNVDVGFGKIYTKEINIDTLVEETTSCILNNKLLDSCTTLMSVMQELYQIAFIECYKEQTTLYSNRILNAYVEIYDKEKLVGTCTRCIYNFNQLSLLEYSGKELGALSNNKLKICINIANKKIYFNSTMMLASCITDIGVYYYTLRGLDSVGINNENGINNNLNNEENKNYHKLNVALNFSTLTKMYDYLLDNNTIEDIQLYKKSIAPEIKLININKFMINEFNI